MAECTVSVLMTVYNTEPYLRASIDSILNQTLSDLELIIVDDCSADDGWTVISEAASRDRRIVAQRRGAQGGASAGLNDGLKRATGRYITRQDSDDISLPRRLAEQVAFLERNPEVGGVGTSAVVIDSRGARVGEVETPERDAEIQAALQTYMCFVGPTVMVRRNAFEKAGLNFDESLSGSEDYDLVLRVAEVAALANLPEPLYLYRRHGESVSYQQKHRQLYRKAHALEKAVRRRFGAVPPPDRFINVASDYLRAAILGHAAEESPGNRDWVARAVALDPALLENMELVESIVQNCTPPVSPGEAAAFVDSLFEKVLPRTRRLTGLRRRIVADFHIREALAPANRGHLRKIGQHLWPALRSNPRWLTNRGVLSLVVGQAVSFGRRSGPIVEASGAGRGDRT